MEGRAQVNSLYGLARHSLGRLKRVGIVWGYGHE
jgi:hypothetical protein